MDNDSEKSSKKKIYEQLIKTNTSDSTPSSIYQKQLRLRNDFTSFKINKDQRNKIDFPLCLSLFTNNKSISNIEPKKKDNNNNKLNLNLKSPKPKNLKNLNLNNIIKKNEHTKKIISRNRNFFNSLSPLNSKFNSHLSKPVKKNNSMLNNINYSMSPQNLMTPKNPIIINQIGISNPIIKLNAKFNNFSNSTTIEQDNSMIKNLKGFSLNSIINNSNSTIKFSEKKTIPSLFSSPFKDDSPQKKNIKKSNKRIINKIKKKVQNDINNYEFLINNLSPRKKIVENKKVQFINITNDKNNDEKKETKNINNKKII
jgi:hypothetical protein